MNSGESFTRLTTRRLKWLGILLPVGFWLAAVAIRTRVISDRWALAFDLVGVTVIAAAAIAFWLLVFGITENREGEIQRRTDQLEALHAAALTLTTELELSTVLQAVVDLSRDLVQARYGALGVLDEDGRSIAQFITAGISAQERSRMGHLPKGHGLLGVLIKEGKPIRIPQIAADPRSAGFPPHHPPMHALLGVPIRSKGVVIGDIYLTDKLSGTNRDGAGYSRFTRADQDLLEMFATQAAIAIENAQLYRQTRQLAVLQERERFSMDLHDGIIQSIYAIGLMLEDAQYHIPAKPDYANERITHAVSGLNEVIRDIRNYIMELRPQRFEGRDLNRGIQELAREIRAHTFLNVQVDAMEIEPNLLTPEQTVEILHIAQEALANVRKHARASHVHISTVLGNGRLCMTISDDGVGIDQRVLGATVGNGLRNMQERANALQGELDLKKIDQGTQLRLCLPIS